MYSHIQQRNTARQSYYSILDKLSGKRRVVFQGLIDIGPASNLDVSKYLEVPINQVTPRMNELVKLEIVVESHRAVHPETGKRVIYWKVKEEEKEQIPLF